MNIKARVEIIPDQGKRWIYNDIKQSFEVLDFPSRMKGERAFTGFYGWIEGYGQPPNHHVDVLVLTKEKVNYGDLFPCKLVGVFHRSDGDHKFIAVDCDDEDDFFDLAFNQQNELYRLYDKNDEQDGWLNKGSALNILDRYKDNRYLEDFKALLPKDFIGSTHRTWVDSTNQRVGRIFTRDQFNQIKNIHLLMNDLRNDGLPLEKVCQGPIFLKDHVIYFYDYKKPEEEDVNEEGWYVPKDNLNRLLSGAEHLASFHNKSRYMIGPNQALDDPFCNHLNWINEADYMQALMGPIYKDVKTLEVVKVFKEKIGMLIEHINIDALEWGLCHCDYHSSNTIFNKDHLELIIDYGFWIHQPILLDIAIALEFWSIDYSKENFELNHNHFQEFFKRYRSKTDMDIEVLALKNIMPLARMYVACYRIRSYTYPKDKETLIDYLSNKLLPKLEWYNKHIDDLFKE